MELLKNSFEGNIVEYYDYFYLPEDKVDDECRYIIDLFDAYNVNYDSLLDVGCGTGAYSSRMGCHFKRVLGVDISADMISYASVNHCRGNVDYVNSDIQNLGIIDEFDAAISLAHVVGYQYSDSSVGLYFDGIRNHLKNGGLFLFNFYNSPALFINKLESRSICKTYDGIELTRVSNARNNIKESCVELDYYYLISKEGVLKADEIHEKIRYFTKTEISLFLRLSGFELLSFFNYGKKEKLTCDYWNAGCIARRVKNG